MQFFICASIALWVSYQRLQVPQREFPTCYSIWPQKIAVHGDQVAGGGTEEPVPLLCGDKKVELMEHQEEEDYKVANLPDRIPWT